MAVVYRARDERLDRSVAVKLLAPSMAADTGFRQRFIRESRAAAAVDHPNIIPIYEAGESAGVLFIAMRFVHGGDVKSLLERDGPLPAARACAIISQVAEALDAAHAHGLIHRDVKPANMLLDAVAAMTGPGHGPARADQREHVYLSDFGISKQPLAASSLTMTGQFVGTLDYIAPEQIGGTDIDGRADLYSLGCAAFELLSGTPPFQRDQVLGLVKAHLSEPPPSLAARRGDLPSAADRVLAGAMAKSPDERYATCTQFATNLGRSLGLFPGETETPGVPRDDSAGPAVGRPWPATEFAAGIAPPAAAPESQQATSASSRPDPVRTDPRLPGGAGDGWSGRPTGPGGSGGPAWQPPEPRRRSRGMIVGVVAAAVGVAAAIAAVGIVLLGRSHTSAPSSIPVTSPTSVVSPSSTSPAAGISPAAASPSPASSLNSAPPETASVEADAVSSLLTSSASTRAPLQPAVDHATNCADPAQAVRQIRQIRNQRQGEYSQAQGLATDALPDGTELKSDLTQALFYSLSADNDYLRWARQQVTSGCQFSAEATTVANANNVQAVNYKNMFVSLWNPVADQYRLPETSQADI